MKQMTKPSIYYELLFDESNGQYRHNRIYVWIREPHMMNGETSLPSCSSDHYTFKYQSHQEGETWRPAYAETLDIPSPFYPIRSSDFDPIMTLLKRMDKVRDKMNSQGVTFTLPVMNDDFYYRIALLKAIGAKEIHYSTDSHEYSLIGCYA